MSELEKKKLQESSSIQKIKKDEVIFYEEELLDHLYSICEGVCKFSFIDDKGKEHITKLLGKGDLMGRRSVITNKGALVTATAITDTLLYYLDKKPVLQCLYKNNSFCQDVLKGFIDDMEDETEKNIYFQNHKKIKARLAGLLLYLGQKFGMEKKGWLKISLRRKEIADILGTTSEYIISLLTLFKDNNFISLHRRKIKINNNNELVALMNSK